MQCRLCSCQTTPVLSLGYHPLPNRFLSGEEVEGIKSGVLAEPTYPMELLHCDNCGVAQLSTSPPPEELFSHYLYASGVSPTFRQHFADLARYITNSAPKAPGKLVDIGSNDGVLLEPLHDMGWVVVGVEPAANLAEMACERGLPTLNTYLSGDVVEQIGPGTATVVTACNVMAHIPNIHDAMNHIGKLLAPDGLLVMEVQYFPWMLRDLTYDNIYLEHVYYWGLGPMSVLLAMHGFTVLDVSFVNTHGGSLRVVATHKQPGAREYPQMGKLLALERRQVNRDSLDRFSKHVQDCKAWFLETLDAEAGNVAGYGAPAKSTTILNYCGVGPERVRYIVDDAPLKQGRYTPSSHIPILAPCTLAQDPPQAILLLAWNYARVIIEKTRNLKLPYIYPIPSRYRASE